MSGGIVLSAALAIPQLYLDHETYLEVTQVFIGWGFLWTSGPLLTEHRTTTQ